MIKAVIFDCFGVVKGDALDIAYRKFGGNPDKDRRFIFETLEKVNRGIIPTSMPIFAKKLGITVEEWWPAIQDASPMNYELLDYVLVLGKKYKTAMLSNIGPGGLSRHFEDSFLDKYFEVNVASGDIGFAKPEAQAYEIVADKLGVRLDECVMIDDRQEYCDGATAVGMDAILYTNLPQLKESMKKYD